MTNTTTEQFDLTTYIDDLIKEMGMQNEDARELAILKDGMAEALHNALFHAASNNIEPEVIDMVMEDLQDEQDAWYIIEELMKTSPAAQIAMVQALDEFRENTLEAYKQLK